MKLGIAARLIYDLGLHADPANLTRQSQMSHQEGKLRSSLFSIAFVYDALWSLYFGRPGAISLSVFEAAMRNTRSALVSIPTLDAWLDQCVLMTQITDILNSPHALDRHALDRLLQLDHELATWYSSLPPTLKGQDGKFSELDASAFGLNMQYSGMRITVHRSPVMTGRSNWNSYDVQHQEPLPSWTSERSREISYENAVRIARLINCYTQIYGVEKIVTVMLDSMFVAGIALVSHTVELHGQGSPTEQTTKWLRSLHSIMDKVQKHYPVVACMKSTLSHAIESTSMATVFQLGNVR